MTEFNLEPIGKATDFSSTTLEAEAGITYAKATNDPTPLHLDGTYIPPIYGVVPVWEKVFEIVSQVVPEEHFFQVVHGEQDMIFHQPLKSGVTLKSCAQGLGVLVKDSGTSLIVKTESFDEATGQLVLEQYFTMFFRGVNGGKSVGPAHDTGLNLEDYSSAISQGESAPTYIASTVAHMDSDQTTRYAHASGDYMPIHLDDEFAKSVGLGGIIIHGLCTMAHACWAAIENLCDSDPTRLDRIAVRFSKPLRPGDDLRTSFFSSDSSADVDCSERFYMVSDRLSDSEVILGNALVEVHK